VQRKCRRVTAIQEEHTAASVDRTQDLVDSCHTEAKNRSALWGDCCGCGRLDGSGHLPCLLGKTLPLAARKTPASRNKGKERKA
jgi:hypothetical protein